MVLSLVAKIMGLCSPIYQYLADRLQTRNRRIIFGVFCFVVVTSLFRSSWMSANSDPGIHDNRVFGGQSGVSPGQRCLQEHIAFLQQQVTVPFVMLDSRQSGVPFIGNGQVSSDILSGDIYLGRYEHGSNRVLGLHVPWLSLVQPDLATLAPNAGPFASHTLLDTKLGAVRRVSEAMLESGSCAVVEELFYAHRRDTSLAVQEVRLVNYGMAPVTLGLRPMHSQSVAPPGALPLLWRNLTAPQSMRAFVLPADRDTYALVIAGAAPESVSAGPGETVLVKTVTSATLLAGLPEVTSARVEGGDGAKEVKVVTDTAVLAEIRPLHATLSRIHRDPHTLRSSHEVAWGRMRGIRVEVEGNKALQRSIHGGLYYLHSALEFTSPTSTLRSPRASGSASGGLADVRGANACFNDNPVRDGGDWVLPSRASEVDKFVSMWEDRVHRGGCDTALASQGRTEEFIKAVVQALTGLLAIEGSSAKGTMLRVTPSWDLHAPTQITVENFPFAAHLLHITLSHSHITVARDEDLSEVLFAVGHTSGKPHVLGAEHRLVFSPGPLYMSLDAATATEVRNKDNHNFHQPVQHGSWPKGLVTFLIFAVIGFHILLMKVIFSEFCGNKPDAKPSSSSA